MKKPRPSAGRIYRARDDDISILHSSVDVESSKLDVQRLVEHRENIER
jgi:hypothetical protein